MSQAPINQDPLVARVAALEGRLAGVEKRLDDVVGAMRDLRAEFRALTERTPSKLEVRTLAGVLLTAILGVGGLVIAALARLPGSPT